MNPVSLIDETDPRSDNYLSKTVQNKETTDIDPLTDLTRVPGEGRLLSLDLGTKKVGVAVSDELRLTVKPVKIIERGSWKRLLVEIKELISVYDASALVLGLPLNSDGTESEMSIEARRLARNFSLSLEIPVVLHDERLTSWAARGRLWASGAGEKKVRARLDSEAAAIILEDLIEVVSSKKNQ